MRNVVLVTVDSLRADHVGSYGYRRDTTPVIDEFANDGLSFEAYANANWTRASFPSVITSTYPLEYGGFEYLADERITVGEAIQKSGHTTGAFHSNLWLSRDYNYNRGFDHFYDSKSDPSLLARLRTYLKLNLDHDGVVYRTLQRLYDTTEEKTGVDVGQTYKDAETITDEALDWFHDVDEPFFCWIHYMDVHHPYIPHDDAAEKLGLDRDISEREAIQLRRKMVEEPELISDEEYQRLIDLYDMEIRYTDTQIGRLKDAINTQFGTNETAFIVTADHGEEFQEHGQFSHNAGMYDEVLSVPLVVSGDSIHPDGHQNELVELLDIPPTCCDLAGAPVPDTYRGRSVLDAAGSGTDASVIAETWNQDEYKLALRTRQWKYIWDRHSGTTELYNLEYDPEEQNNVVREYSEIAADLRDQLQAHLEEIRETNTDLPNIEMDSETEERLKNLGYLE
jgi:arylsulfatase A-like enzyme